MPGNREISRSPLNLQKQEKNFRRGYTMKKEETLFRFLRTLVRQGELRPAYARQIYLKHMESSGKKIPFGHALWLNRGWEYDRIVWGSKKAAKGYYDEYRDSPYCPVYKLPFVPGYDRRAGKARVFGPDTPSAPSAPSGKIFEKILKNIKKVVDIIRVHVLQYN